MEVRIPATFKYAFDLHPGAVSWYDHEEGRICGSAPIDAIPGDSVEVQLELKGIGRLVYFEMIVETAGARNRAGITEFEFRVIRMSPEDQAAVIRWLPSVRPPVRGGSPTPPPRAPAYTSLPPGAVPTPAAFAPPRAAPAPKRPVAAPPVVEIPRRAPPPSPAAPTETGVIIASGPRTVRVDWERRALSVRWATFEAFATEWEGQLRLSGLSIPAYGDTPAFHTPCRAALFFPDGTSLVVGAAVVGMTGIDFAIQVEFTRADRQRLQLVADQGRQSGARSGSLGR